MSEKNISKEGNQKETMDEGRLVYVWDGHDIHVTQTLGYEYPYAVEEGSFVFFLDRRRQQVFQPFKTLYETLNNIRGKRFYRGTCGIAFYDMDAPPAETKVWWDLAGCMMGMPYYTEKWPNQETLTLQKWIDVTYGYIRLHALIVACIHKLWAEDYDAEGTLPPLKLLR